MADKVIQSLIFRLIADETDLVKSLKASEKRLDALGDKFISVGKKASLGLTVPIVAAGTAMVAAAMESEKATKLLENAIQAAGNQGKVSAKNLSEYAGQLQLISVYDDEATMSAFTLLEQMTALDEDGLKALMPSIQNLASALDMDLQSAASLVGKTIGSDTNALGRYGIEVDAGASKSEKMAQVLQGLAKYQGAAATEAGTFSGKMAILKNQVGDLAEQFGNELLPVISNVVSSLSGMVKQFSELTPEQKKAILVTAGLAAAIGPLLIGVGNAIKLFSTLKIVMAAASGPAGWITLAVGALALVGKAIWDNIQAQREYDKMLAGTSNKTAEEQIKVLESKLKEAREQLKQITDSWGEYSEKYKKAIQGQVDSLNADIKAHEDRIKSLKESIKPTNDLTGATNANAKAAEDSAKAQKVYADALDVAKKAIDDNKSDVDKLRETFIALFLLQTKNADDEAIKQAGLAALRKKIRELEIAGVKETEGKKQEEFKATYDYIESEIAKYREAKQKETDQVEAENAAQAASDKKKVEDTTAIIDRSIKAIGTFAKATQQDISETWDDLSKEALSVVSDIAKSTGSEEGFVVAAVAQGLSLIVDLVASAIDYEKNLAANYADTINNVNKSILDNKIKVLKDELSATLETIDAEKKAKLAAIDEEEKQALIKAGVLEDTAVQALEKKLAKETDLEKKAELEKELARAKIQEEYQAKRDAAEAKAAADKEAAQKAADKALRQLEYDRAVWERKITIAQIEIERAKAKAELGWFQEDKKAEIDRMYNSLISSVNEMPLPKLARGGSFIVPPGFEQDSFPITTALAKSGERVTVETPEQQSRGGATFQIGTVIADPAGLRELERLLNKYGNIEYQRRG